VKFEHSAWGLYQISMVSRDASGRSAEKSMISCFVHEFRSLRRFDASGFKVGQPLDVLADGHHCDPKVGTGLSYRANQLATHLHDHCKDMSDPSSYLEASLLTPLLSFGKLALGCSYLPNLRPRVMAPQIRHPRPTGIGPISASIRTCVESIEPSIGVPTVLKAGGIGHRSPKLLVAPDRIYREPVAQVSLSLLVGPSGVLILLPMFRRVHVRWGGLLIEQYMLFGGDTLLSSWNQGHVNDFTSLGQSALPKQLRIRTLKEGCRTACENSIPKAPHRCAIRNNRRHRQTTKPLKAQTVHQGNLDLLAGKIVQPFRHQNPNQGHSCKGWQTVLGQKYSWGYAINLAGQRRKVQYANDLDPRITQAIDLSGSGLSSNQIIFDNIEWYQKSDFDQKSIARLFAKCETTKGSWIRSKTVVKSMIGLLQQTRRTVGYFRTSAKYIAIAHPCMRKTKRPPASLFLAVPVRSKQPFLHEKSKTP